MPRLTAMLLGTALLLTCGLLHAQDGEVIAAAENVVILPEPIRDPLEPMNRGLWAVNRGLMTGVVQPTSKGYRVLVPKPLRKGIRNAGRNIGYPRRVINNLLQERWTGARDETYRFLCNSIFGIGGLFDVGTRWGIPPSEADFGQTFGVWGWRPHFYLMLPIAGPSNDRDAVGSIADGLVNPLTYFPPYSYITHGITYNNLTDTVDDYVRISKADFDPYYVLKHAWTLRRESNGVDTGFEGPQDQASLETLRAVFFGFANEKFPEYRLTRSITVPSTGRKLPFSAWIQNRPAPLVYIVPGLGSHRLGGGTIALAELLYREGFSVATLSSTFNYEFIERASEAAMPGFAPVDSRNLLAAISEFDRFLQDKYRKRFTSRALMGYSMGGFHTLYLAANSNPADPGVSRLTFDRYVAIDAPVDLNYAVRQLDSYFQAAFDWPAAERTSRIERTLLKVAALSDRLDQFHSTDSVIPLSATESKFIIGLAFRLSLRDVIFLGQMRTNQGVLKQPVDVWRREPVYREILQISFGEYIEKFLAPYYLGRGVDLRQPDQFAAATDLRVGASSLSGNPKVRVIVNANDPLLGPEGLSWLRSTLPSERLTVFETGGHLGNLSLPEVQRSILSTVSDLRR